MGTNKRIEHFLGITHAMRRRERGQILVLVAIAMVGLLVATGLAVDAGFLMLRKAQLDRAMDSAVLAGATQTDVDIANTRGLQFLAVNGIIIPEARSGECVDGNLPNDDPDTEDVDESLDYCGHQLPGVIPGSLRYRAIVRWNVPTFFMPLININHVPMVADATAEYYSMVDVYGSDVAEYGLVKTATLELFGPRVCYDYGDAYTPANSPHYNDLNGVYTFRIAIPPTYPYKTIRVELYDPSSASDHTRYWDNDDKYTIWNSENGNVTTNAKCDQRPTIPGTSNDQRNPCLIAVPGDTANPWWFIRTEENRSTTTWGACGQPGSYSGSRNTDTLFRLFYYRQTNTGQFEAVDLAYYRSGRDVSPETDDPITPAVFTSKVAEALATDNMWVAPGAPGGERNAAFDDIFALTDGSSSQPLNSLAEPATTTEVCNTLRNSTVTIHTHPTTPVSDAVDCSTPNNGDGRGDFIITLDDVNLGGVDQDNEVPRIYADPNTDMRYLYLQVRGLNGGTENGYQVWAGPSNLEESKSRVPSEINARQVYIQRMRGGTPPEDYHLSHGLLVYGLGRLPMNHNASNRVEFPLAYLGPEFAGQQLTIQLFDADVGPLDPIYFFFDTIPKSDWIACYSTVGASRCTTTSGSPPGPGAPAWTFLGDDQFQNGLSSQWATYTFKIPSDLDTAHPMPFYGGRLMVSYGAAVNDTFGWYITVEARPTLAN